MNKLYLLILILFTTVAYAQNPDWEDPTVIAKNKMPAHATSYSFKSEDEALKGDRENSRVVLSGTGLTREL